VDASTRHAHRSTLIPAIEAVTATLTTDEVIERLDAAGVPCAPIANYEQVFNDDHLNQRGYFWDAEHPVMGQVRQLGSPMRLSRTPVRRGNAGPRLGQNTRAALEEVAGLSAAEIDALAEAGVVAEPDHPGAPPHRTAASPQPATD
jgi:crotonobetainyl-CoA:carnitine CoA-transferase CaiB-like acyl-CoA transferase